MNIRWSIAWLVGALFVLTACTSAGPAAAGQSAPHGEPTSTTTTTIDLTIEPKPCDSEPVRGAIVDLPAGDEASLIAASAEVYPCADSVVLVSSDSDGQLTEAAGVAIAVGAPMLMYEGTALSDELRAELSRLAPERIRVYGDLDATEIGDLPIVSVFPDDPSTRRPRFDRQLRELLASGPDSNHDRLFLIEPGDERRALAALPLIQASGATATPIDFDDAETLLSLSELAADHEVVVPEGLTPTEQWKVDLALSGEELPGGGTEVFPGRRLVAFYGSPVTSRLGILGEQGAEGMEATLERLQPIAEEYEIEEGAPVVPTFEIIVTVAIGSPGANGDYSQHLSDDVIREWVDFAAENDVFVLLDLQPGRADFLSQAMSYEEFLRQPHVGLALDPEWRLGPNEQPLQRIGSVGAAEVNQVIDWLAEIVREERLPQKPLVLHQFLRRMLTDREQIETPDELAVVVHVDGQGSLASKFATYDNMTTAEIDPDQEIWWGWKNFYDEDRPVASPETVNEVDPLPVVITYQ